MNLNDGPTIVMPAGAPSIAQGFRGNTKENNPSAHVGLDIVATIGTPVLAVAPGEVKVVNGYDPMSGRRIVIDHGKDRSGTVYSTRYFHLVSQLVKTGDQVKRGQIIGRVGATGLLASYPHLHFELHRGDGFGQAVNPHEYWLDGPGRVTCFVPDTSVQASQFRMTYPVKCMTADETS
jgi:murein DD-endopeptidase MepM/ murein hydrolase activator NlpD